MIQEVAVHDNALVGNNYRTPLLNLPRFDLKPTAVVDKFHQKSDLSSIIKYSNLCCWAMGRRVYRRSKGILLST